MKISIVMAAFALLAAAPCFAKTCASYDESLPLKPIDEGLADCNSSKGSFVVNLPTGVSYKLYQNGMDKGDSCGVSETKTSGGVRVTITVDMSPDSTENCQLYMFQKSDPSDHATMSISAEIDS